MYNELGIIRMAFFVLYDSTLTLQNDDNIQQLIHSIHKRLFKIQMSSKSNLNTNTK